MVSSSQRLRGRTRSLAPVERAERAAATDPPRLLLAEDDADMRRWLAHALRAAGYDVLQAADGRALRELVSRMLDGRQPQPVDLIVADIRLPGCSGLDVLRRLRGADWALPCVLMTAFGDQQTHDEARRLGALDLLDKPFDIEQLLRAVARAAPLDGRHASRLPDDPVPLAEQPQPAA